MSLILLSCLWIGWCVVHSLLIAPVVIGAIESRVPGVARYYRLLYNALAFLTLVPLAIVTGRAGGPLVFVWQGWGSVIRILLLGCALLLFRGGAKQYDMQYVVGLKQLWTGKTPLLLTDSPDFSAEGVFGLIRHPWYLGSLLLIWSALPVYPLPKFVAAVILSCYLVIGTLLEERKIIARHGERYRAYQQRVSMLFPWKWLKKKLE